MEHLAPVLEIIALCLDVFSIFVLVWGAAIAAKDFIFSYLLEKDKNVGLENLNAIRKSLGIFVLLSLEILIAADIIDSIVKPNVQDLLKLAVIVAIRTVISFFLNREIAENEAQIAKPKLLLGKPKEKGAKAEQDTAE